MFGQRRNPFLGTDMPASYTAGLGDDIARRKAGGFDGVQMVNDQNPYLQQPQSMMAPQMEQPKPKGGGLFGKQSALWKVLGTLGDGLTGNPVYGQMQQQERQTLMQQERERQKAEDAQRAQMEERQYDQGEWDRRQQYERDNPKPQAPHYWETNDGSLGTIGADGKPQVLYKDPTPKVSYQRVDNGDGTFTMHPVINGQIVGGGVQPQNMPAPGTVMADPRLKGGSAPQAQGNFR